MLTLVIGYDREAKVNDDRLVLGFDEKVLVVQIAVEDIERVKLLESSLAGALLSLAHLAEFDHLAFDERNDQAIKEYNNVCKHKTWHEGALIVWKWIQAYVDAYIVLNVALSLSVVLVYVKAFGYNWRSIEPTQIRFEYFPCQAVAHLGAYFRMKKPRYS